MCIFKRYCHVLAFTVTALVPAQATVVAYAPPIFIEVTIAADISLPKIGTVFVPVALRVVNQTSKSLSLDEPNGCKTESWAVAEPGASRSERTLANGDTGMIYDPAAAENHTFCPAISPRKSTSMGPRESRTLLIKLPFDAAAYQNGRVYKLYYYYWGAQNLATFTVHKPD